ncbi:MAG: DUF6178 family protein [Deferrisomatales bacterium]
MPHHPRPRPVFPSPTPTPLRREIDAVLSVRGHEREDRLLVSSNLGAVVGLMPPEELYFTLKELDADNVPDVLRHARTEQVELVLDLELWKGDRIRRERVLPWLGRLHSCGEEALGRWLQRLDLATWVLLLGSVAAVHLADEERDPFQELPGRAPFTLEGRYYIATSPEAEPLVRDLLRIVRDTDPDRYARLVEALMRDLDSELEEAEYQERQRRLALRGFPPREEALEVYAPLRASIADELPRRPRDPKRDSDEPPAAPPRYPVALPDATPDVFLHALRHVPPGPTLDGLWSDLAYLTNKVAVADRLDLDDLGSFQAALRKVSSYVSVGLESLCDLDEAAAARALEEHWLQHLFQAGWGPIRALRGRARGLFEKGWPQGHKERLLFLDSPLPEVLEGLLRVHPLWYAGEGETPPYRPFRALGEVRRAERTVDQADFLGRFLLSIVELHLGDLKEARVGVETENLKGSTVFLTALVNAALERSFRFAPIPRNDVRQGLSRVWASETPPRRVKPGLDDTAVEWAKAAGDLTPSEEGHLREFVGGCFWLLEEEFGHLAVDEVPDPRFTRGLWIV